MKGFDKGIGNMDQWIRVPLCGCGEKLYHYTMAEGLKGIVTQRQFLATKSDFLNDKMEFLYSLEIMEQLVKTYIVNKELGQRFLSLVKEEINKLAIITPSCYEACGEKENSFYVVAFSKVQNSALLWAEFTDFKGYCLEFDYESLVAGFSDRAFLHGTVIYDEEEQKACLLEALLSCMHKGGEKKETTVAHIFEESCSIKEEELRELAEDMAIVCSVYAMFFKKSFFQGEEEYRFIFSPLQDNTGKDAKPLFRTLDQMFLPYIMVEYNNQNNPVPLESVMVGAKNNSDIAVRGVRYFLKGEGLEVPVLLSDIPLRY